MFQQLGLIGCGLMGGSFALALKKAGLVRSVVGYSKSSTTLEKACQLGVIDRAAQSAQQAVSGSDIVLIAVPVSATHSTFAAIKDNLKPGILVMDVGSTKRDVINAAKQVLQASLPCFVPAHPIAGKETGGIEHADAQLYQGKQVILTPIEQTDPVSVQQATQVWTAMGCNVLKMSAESHDAAFAAVSHLPHLLAFAYIHAIASQPAGNEFLALAGSGFRDFSRIAASEPTVWRDILLANRDEILKQSAAFRACLDHFEALLQNGSSQELAQAITTASTVRSHWTMHRQAKKTSPP